MHFWENIHVHANLQFDISCLHDCCQENWLLSDAPDVHIVKWQTKIIISFWLTRTMCMQEIFYWVAWRGGSAGRITVENARWICVTYRGVLRSQWSWQFADLGHIVADKRSTGRLDLQIRAGPHPTRFNAVTKMRNNVGKPISTFN